MSPMERPDRKLEVVSPNLVMRGEGVKVVLGGMDITTACHGIRITLGVGDANRATLDLNLDEITFNGEALFDLEARLEEAKPRAELAEPEVAECPHVWDANYEPPVCINCNTRMVKA